ncbi:MAG TPA: HAMP domain-containing sensor histidine kinase [Petrotogaceae bacterium]|nr:HAMP domain-containing sensor histidine kinase [Petrotogaceae bacterium]HQF33103.1 HAMP domain-containing sensor histidine kinase [Petrotogaceae bacterium]HQI77965.1 HAMP domain-containing sensor histidine kinase [Petrotogaceae bacterium]
MSKSIGKIKKSYVRRSQIFRHLFAQYVLTFIGFVVVFAVFIFVMRTFLSTFSWQADNLFYKLLKSIDNYIFFWIGSSLLIGWLVITYYFFQKPLRYLDELVMASEQLAKSVSEPIVLPDSMKDVQDELNQVREQTQRNAMAAKEAEQRKNDLIVYLAHDLKTPLTSVIGYLALLRDEPQISKELRAKYTGIALDKAERLEALINEFFDITRFNLTRLILDTRTVNLTRMLEQITFEFNPLLAEKSLKWDLRLIPDLQTVCDPEKMERVFDNLIRNAVNYSYNDTKIILSMERLEEYAIIRVENRGHTIPPEKLSRIFEQFFRLDQARSSSTGGAGLGLAIAREIVQSHGGTITAESIDESIVFTVKLPLDCKKNV